MPAYSTALTSMIDVGGQVALINAADSAAGNVTKTIAVLLGRSPNAAQMAFFNTTNQTATIQSCWQDVDANYVSASTPTTIAAGSVLESLTSIGPFVRCTFQTAPTSGVLIVVR